MDNPVAKALHDGLDRLRERGLTKHQLCDSTGSVCIRGALVDARPLDDMPLPVFHGDQWEILRRADALIGAIAREQYPERVVPEMPGQQRDAVNFNNHPDTTQEDVERIFEKAIVKAYETL